MFSLTAVSLSVELEPLFPEDNSVAHCEVIYQG